MAEPYTGHDIRVSLRDKDAALYDKLAVLPANLFWREWKQVYPEDFPEGGLSLAAPSSVMRRTDLLQNQPN